MKKIFKPGLLTFICLLTTTFLFAQQDLRSKIIYIATQINGVVSVSVTNLETGDTLNYNGNSHMVMHSVMKLPIAMTVLHQVDKGKLKFDQKIHITKADLPETYSPLRDKYPEGDVDIAVSQLLSYMVSLSDNDACDILLKVLGGTATVEKYVHSIGVKDISIKASEAQMASAWPVQYTNWCSAKAINQLLGIMYKGSALSKRSNDFLWKIMLETSTGPKRLKGLLPNDAKVVHKTGTSPVNNDGLAAATNDAGIMILPNGRHIAISVFITDSYADNAKRESVIAQIAKAVWDEYSK
ncbi:class A beta-lactamase, subclass A2 [Mucilaginibacter limnophilus]|uniref:beta-lactamase n=1 Tax=Mucilaginibacter limnophilus TaxID=1932778 RepID=A0A437MFX8_9SPHI|nr:class A beta-lactamase, subclass A2 [Mucilaginibacter limnophilus]RVT96566.1 class A beta-lactamase, subclass A2 [Mucilaginibacter limnophilus]